MTADARAHVIVTGRVQGVFFRAETQRAAKRIGVQGWVRNKPDGTVEAIFEGPRDLVNQAVDWCWKGSPMSQVTDVKVQWGQHTREFQTFSIVH
jgi:acylphosphatase